MDFDVNKFYSEKFKPYWDANQQNLKEFTDKAEKYFIEIMKLMINLSTGLAAFVSVADKILPDSFSAIEIKSVLCKSIFAIVFAVLALVSLSINYKKYADNTAKDMESLLKKFMDKDYDGIEKTLNKTVSGFLDGDSRKWQDITIILGILSFACFIWSIAILVGFLA